MLKGLVLTPPVIGRISIGQVVEKDGKRLPQKMINSRLPLKYKREMAGRSTL